MRGGEDERMQLDPMFPRLHTDNTAEKGGPTPSPRNKMALCQQVHSRFCNGSLPLQPLPSANSPSPVHCQKKDVFSLFYSSSEPPHVAAKIHSNYSNLKASYLECQFLKPGNHQALNAARRPLRMPSDCKLFHPFENSVNSSAKLLGKEDDIRIPFFDGSEKVLTQKEEQANTSSLQSLGKHQTAFKKQEKKIERTNVISRDRRGNQAENNPSSFVDDSSTLHHTGEQMHQECRSSPTDNDCMENVSRELERISRKRIFLAMEDPTCSSPPAAGENNRIHHRFKPFDETPKRNDRGSSRVEEIRRSTAISIASTVDSMSCLDISPDDVVRVIGPKFFWRVRKTIAHQQRIFAAQIFELHRLIKVQRLIAGSPEMLVEENVIFSKPSNYSFPDKKLQLENFPELPAPLKLEPKADLQKPKPLSGHAAAEDSHRKLPATDDTEEGDAATPNSAIKPHSGVLTATAFAPEEAQFGTWFFQTTGDRWLVPASSPSEGLIYKPHTETSGCVAFTRMDSEYLNNNASYSIPASNQPGMGIYTDPDSRTSFQASVHAMPVINASAPMSGAMQQFGAACSSGQENQSTIYDINYIAPYIRSSGRDQSQRTGITTDSFRMTTVSKGGPPRERLQRDELSLFPTCPTDQHPSSGNNKVQVIKVVPHHPKSASESAARIYRSIQEERNHPVY